MRDCSHHRRATTPQEHLADFFARLETLPEGKLPPAERAALLQSLTTIVRRRSVAEPEALARQILFMAVDSQREGVARQTIVRHAHVAAEALIAAQPHRAWSTSRHWYAMAASCLLALGLGVAPEAHTPPRPSAAHATVLMTAKPATTVLATANPMGMAEILARREKIRQGTCNFPQALMLASGDRETYMRTVVHGEIPQDSLRQAATVRLLQTVRCDYAPMLMKNSIS